MPDSHYLQTIPLFANLSLTQLGWIGSALETRSYQTGEDIFVQGSPADGMLTLLSGQAVLFQTAEDGAQQVLASLAAHQTINQEALFTAAVQSATLRAAQPVTILQLTREKFLTLLAQHPELEAAFGMASDDGIRFDEQRQNEAVLMMTHHHWWAFVRTAWLPCLMMILMWVGAVWIQEPSGALLVFLLSILLPGAGLFYLYREWRNDSVIVTDQRIIRVSRTILALHKQVTEIGLESVHEINFEIPSADLFARLFNYGTVEIKTAGSQGNLELDLIPNPKRFQQLLIEDRQNHASRKAKQHHDLIRAELQSWLAGETPDPLDEPAAAPPQPKRGTNGYLSTRIEMTNGDIVYRKHLSVWVQHTSIPIALMLFSLILLALTFTLVSADMRILTFPLGLVSLLIGAVAYYWVDWDWRNDCYIISDDTITLAHKRPLFLQNIRDQILVERIDNVESVSTGFFATMMKYGDVRMSLIGADEHKMFHRVPNPQEIQQEISHRQHQVAQRRSRYDALQQRQILGEYLNVLQEQAVAKQTEDDMHRRQQPPDDPQPASRSAAHGKPAALPAALDQPKPLPPRFRPRQNDTRSL